MEVLKRIADALQQGEHEQVRGLAAEALGAGLPAGLGGVAVVDLHAARQQYRHQRPPQSPRSH